MKRVWASSRYDHQEKSVNYVIITYYKSNDIQHQLLAALTPQLNRVTERKNKTLKETGRTMIVETHIPKDFGLRLLT